MLRLSPSWSHIADVEGRLAGSVTGLPARTSWKEPAMSAPSQTTSAERLAELLDVKAFPLPDDCAARAKVSDPGGARRE
jgi:hypothetical protein